MFKLRIEVDQVGDDEWRAFVYGNEFVSPIWISPSRSNRGDAFRLATYVVNAMYADFMHDDDQRQSSDCVGRKIRGQVTMSKVQIHTNMIGRKVRILTIKEIRQRWIGGHIHFREDAAGRDAEIVNVYLKKDGSVAYDVLFADGTLWSDCFEMFFRVEQR